MRGARRQLITRNRANCANGKVKRLPLFWNTRFLLFIIHTRGLFLLSSSANRERGALFLIIGAPSFGKYFSVGSLHSPFNLVRLACEDGFEVLHLLGAGTMCRLFY